MSSYRIATWTDERGRTVKRLGFHVSDLDAVLNLQFPVGAVARDPITEYTGAEALEWFHGKRPATAGEFFLYAINQGVRPATVVAVDSDSGAWLFEYVMPNGSSTLKWQDDRNQTYRTITPAWAARIDEQFGLDNLEANPQQSRLTRSQILQLLHARSRKTA